MKNYMFSNMFVVYKRATNLIVQNEKESFMKNGLE